MVKALYRKHRPKKLSEVIGQEPITQTLTNALKTGHISHAYLLTGPRGTGKTSIARILAHEVNQLPYEDDKTHLDIIEIDAASNRRIDEIRELRDRIHIAPTSAKYKVYIIDEVHMLTREAFNALLKTLEEPPEHAIFILATTEVHKLPDTIISRTQRFSLKPVELDTVVAHLKDIATQEKIEIDDDALRLIAEHGQGSFRDSIGLLDQVKMIGNKVSSETIESALGRAPAQLVQDILNAINDKDGRALSEALSKVREHAVQAGELSSQLATVIRHQLLSDKGTPSTASLELLHKLMDVPYAHNPQLALELAVYAPIAKSTSVSEQPADTHEPTPPKPKTRQDTEVEHSTKSMQPMPVEPPEPTRNPVKNPVTDKSTSDIDVSDATDAPTPGDWQDILIKLKGSHNTLYGIARMAKPELSPGSIVLEFSFPFHQKRVSDARYIQILSSTAREVLGYPVSIKTSLAKKKSGDAIPESPQPSADLGKITEIFGDGVAVED